MIQANKQDALLMSMMLRWSFKASESEKALGQIFNIGSNVETSMDQVIKLIIDASGKNLQIKEFFTNNEYGDRYEDISEEFQMYLNKKIMHWEITTSLDEGIKNI